MRNKMPNRKDVYKRQAEHKINASAAILFRILKWDLLGIQCFLHFL